MSIHFQPTRLVGAIALAMGFSSTAFAQIPLNDQAIALDTIVVTASKTPESIKNVPARITVIDQKTLERDPLLNLSDSLQKDPSVYIKQSGGLGQTSELSLRGTKAIHTLILKDGARLNSQNDLAPFYSGFLDTNDVQQVEILKGPASVQYGTDAVSGVIQMISKVPQKTGAALTGIYAENNTYKTIVNADLVSDTGIYAQIGGQRLESDGTRIFESQNDQEKASYDQKGYHAKVGFFQKDLADASLSISQNKGVNIFSNDYIVNNAPREFENQVINAKGSYVIQPNLTLAARYSNVKDQQNVPAYASHYDTENNEGDIHLGWNFLAQHNLLVGVSYLKAEYDSNTINQDKQTVDSTGYYVQHQFKNDLLDTQLGVRLEDNERFGQHTVGQGAIRYHVLPNASIYTNIGTAFRAPTLNEMYTQWGGNPELEPEKSTSYEIGADYQFNQNFAANISLYQNEIKNLISYKCTALCTTANYVSTFPIYQNINIDKAKFTGGELGLKWQQNDYFLSTQYAYVKTENKETGLEIAYRPKNTVTLTTGIENATYGLSVSAIARSKANASNSTNPVKVQGYATVDLDAYWNINPNVKLFTNIQNLGDVQYREVYNTYPTKDWYINGGRLASAGVTFRY